MPVFRKVRAWVETDVLQRCVGAEFDPGGSDLARPYNALYSLLLQKGLDVTVRSVDGQWALEGDLDTINQTGRLLEQYLVCLDSSQTPLPDVLDACSAALQTATPGGQTMPSGGSELTTPSSAENVKQECETKKVQTEMVDCALFTHALDVNVDETDETVQFLTDDGVSIGFLKFEQVFPKRPKKKKKQKGSKKGAASEEAAPGTAEGAGTTVAESAPTGKEAETLAPPGPDAVSPASNDNSSEVNDAGDTIAEVAASVAARSLGLVQALEKVNCIATIIPKPPPLPGRKTYKKREKGLPAERVQPTRRREAPVKHGVPKKRKKRAAKGVLTVKLPEYPKKLGAGRPKGPSKKLQDPVHKYQCQICCFAAPLKKLLQEHMNHKHSTKFKKCPVCPKRYTNDRDLQLHMRNHKELHQCEKCGKRYKFLNALRYHEKCHEEGYIKSPIPCSMCEKTFSTHNAVKLHIDNVHLNKKDFLCNYCGKAFAQKRGLIEHENVHMGRKPFECKICGVAFHFSSSLKDHENTHDLTMTFTCQYCQKTFSSRGSLKTHMAIHTSQDKFKCDHCSKSFYQKAARDRHMRTHTGEKPYPCKLCNQKFSDNGILRRHMIGLHKQTLVRGKRGRKSNNDSLCGFSDLAPVERVSRPPSSEVVPTTMTTAYSGMGDAAEGDMSGGQASFPNLTSHVNAHMTGHTGGTAVQSNHHLVQQQLQQPAHMTAMGATSNPSTTYSNTHTVAHQHQPIHRNTEANNIHEAQASNRNDMLGHTLDLSDHHGSVDMRTSLDLRSHSETVPSNSQALYAHHLNLAAMQPGIDGNPLYRFPTTLPYMMPTPSATSVSSINNFPSHAVAIPTDSNGRPLVFPPFNIPN